MSCGIIFLSENLVDQASVSLTTGTENAQFPLLNIKNAANAIKFRSQENVVVIEFDMLQTRTIDAVALHGDTNGTLGLTTATYKYSLTTDFTSSPTVNIDLSGEHLLGYDLLASPVSARYIELTLTGTGSYVELSTIFIGKKIEIEQNNLSIDSFRYSLRDNSITSNNRYDQLFVDKRNVTKYVSGQLQFCTKSEHEILDEMFRRHQRSVPIWMIVDKDGAGMIDGEYKLTTYGYLEEVVVWSASGGNHYSANIRVNQAG